MPSLWGEKATFAAFLWVRGLYQLINYIVKMKQLVDEEKQDHEHLWRVGNLTETQKNNNDWQRLLQLNSIWFSTHLLLQGTRYRNLSE